MTGFARSTWAALIAKRPMSADFKEAGMLLVMVQLSPKSLRMVSAVVGVQVKKAVSKRGTLTKAESASGPSFGGTYYS